MNCYGVGEYNGKLLNGKDIFIFDFSINDFGFGLGETLFKHIICTPVNGDLHGISFEPFDNSHGPIYPTSAYIAGDHHYECAYFELEFLGNGENIFEVWVLIIIFV